MESGNNNIEGFIREIFLTGKIIGFDNVIPVLKNHAKKKIGDLIPLKEKIEEIVYNKALVSEHKITDAERRGIVIFIMCDRFNIEQKTMAKIYDLNKATVSISCNAIASIRKNNPKNKFMYNLINETIDDLYTIFNTPPVEPEKEKE